jgi:hypothetical protein
MADVIQSVFQRSARQRWQGYDIEGDGRIACVLHCDRRVVLCTSPMMANTVAGERCGPGCSHIICPYGGFHKQAMLSVQAQYVPSGLFDE